MEGATEVVVTSVLDREGAAMFSTSDNFADGVGRQKLSREACPFCSFLPLLVLYNL